MRRDMNLSQGRHSRQSGNLGKNWIPGEAWNDKRHKIHVVMYSKLMPWIFFSPGKDQPGFPFPTLIFFAARIAFHKAPGKTPGPKGTRMVFRKAEKKSPRPRQVQKIFSPAKGKKN
jgi:hypothetical protein